MRGTLLAVGWLWMGLASAAEPPLQVKVRQTGFAKSPVPDLDAARADALEQARRPLLSAAADQLLADDPTLRKCQLFEDRVMRGDYLSNLTAVSEKRLGDNGVELVVRADVDSARLLADAAALRPVRDKLSHKKVMVAIAATLDVKGVKTSPGTARAAFEQMLRGDGWQVVPSQDLESDAPEAIAAAVQKQPADFIIYGRETFSAVPAARDGLPPQIDGNGRQVVFFLDSSWELELVDVAARQPIGRASGSRVKGELQGLVISYDASVSSYAAAIAASAADALRQPALDASSELLLEVTGLARSDAEAFASFARKTKALKSIAAKGTGFTIEPTGTLYELAKALDGKSFKGHKLAVQKVTATSVTVQLKP